jgi:hypothetical protein
MGGKHEKSQALTVPYANVAMLITLLSVSGISVVTAETTEIHKLRILGPESASLHFKISEREKYPLWTVFENDLRERGLEIGF